MSVAEIIKDKVGAVITATVGDSLQSIAGKLARHHIGAVVVLDAQGGIAGMVLEGDVVRAVANGQACTEQLTAEHVMSPCRFTCRVETTEQELLDVMCTEKVQYLPVISGGRLAGIVSLGDVVRLRRRKIRAMMQDIERQAETERFTSNLQRRRQPSTADLFAQAV